MLFTPDRDLDPPNEPETQEVQRCDNCHEIETTYILGITIYDLFPCDRVCSYCLNELHNNISLTN